MLTLGRLWSKKSLEVAFTKSVDPRAVGECLHGALHPSHGPSHTMSSNNSISGQASTDEAKYKTHLENSGNS